MTVNLQYYSMTLKWLISGLLKPDIFFQKNALYMAWQLVALVQVRTAGFGAKVVQLLNKSGNIFHLPFDLAKSARHFNAKMFRIQYFIV